MLAKNQYDIANWFMHARVSVCTYVAIHRHATWWLIDHVAHETSISNIIYVRSYAYS